MGRWNRTALAYRNLMHNWQRLVVALSGVAFAVLLMFMQTGYNNALLDSTAQVIEVLDADVVIVSKNMFALPSVKRFSMQRIAAARACPGVIGVYPLYIEAFAGSIRKQEEKAFPVRVLAFDPGDPVFRIDDINKQTQLLQRPSTAIIDTRSKAKQYHFPPGWDGETAFPEPLLLAGQTLKIGGGFEMGSDFANEGNIVMSSQNFADYFPMRNFGGPPLDSVDVGVVQVEGRSYANTLKVIEELKRRLPADVKVKTKYELAQQEREFWSTSTPVGFVFTIGWLMGFVIGVIICYQIIYSNIADHMPEYATLKAIGYKNSYFISLVLAESFYLAVLGFIPGLLITWAAFTFLSEATGLVMEVKFYNVATIFGGTVLMCGLSGCLAVFKVFAADPAELF